MGAWGEGPAPGLLKGLKLAAVAVVAACAALAWSSPWTQVGVIAIAGAIGLVALRTPLMEDGHAPLTAGVGRGLAVAMLAVFVALLVGLPALARMSSGWAASMFDAFYRAGALVYGGGHVVLPLAGIFLPGFLVLLGALVFWRAPPWAVVIASAALGWARMALPA